MGLRNTELSTLEEKEKNEKRIKVFRQDRIDAENEKCFLEIESKEYKVLNFSAFGVAIEADREIPRGTTYYGCLFSFGSVEVSKINIVCARVVPNPEGRIICAFEVISEPVNIHVVNTIVEIQRIVSEQEQQFKSVDLVPEPIRLKIYQMRDWLEALQKKVIDLEQNKVLTDGQVASDFENTVSALLGRYIGDYFPTMYRSMSEYLGKMNESQKKACIEFFRSSLKDIIYQSPFAHRVFHKPQGYAGDYEMMNLIYRQENVGTSLFGKCLQNYWINEPSAQAVRNRSTFLVKELTSFLSMAQKNQKIKILSVACGPAFEWSRLIKEIQKYNDYDIEVHLLDQDKDALSFAQRKMREASCNYKNSINFKYLQKSVKHVIVKGLEENDYDMIYSAGLFDYLSDPVAQMTATKLFGGLKKGGSLVIGSFNISNPNEVIMDIALDWHLIYRSETEMKKLFEHVGGKMVVLKEDLDINLFCKIEK